MVRASQLKRAMRARYAVRFESPFEEGRFYGYVVAVGPSLFLMAVVEHGCRFDGFQVHHMRDVREFERDPYSAVVGAALRARGERRPRTPRIGLASVRAVLRSAGRAFPLVTIFRERAKPDSCWVGRVLKVGEKKVSLREISPGAEWNDESTEFPLREITRVDIGGTYEAGLLLVGGEPPARSG
jgi:hypothetical protein